MKIHKLLLYLYPLAWRERYEDEFLLVFASQPFSLFEALDVLRGALDVHLHPQLGTKTLPLPDKLRRLHLALRSSLLILFCAFIGFLLAGMGFQKMTEDGTFQQVSQSASLVGISFQLVIIGAVIALLGGIAGGLPIAMAIIKSALARRRYTPLFLLTVPFLAFAFFVLILSLLKVLDHSGLQPLWLTFLYRGTFLATVLCVAIVSTGALCLAVTHSEIPGKLLGFAVLPSILVTLAMGMVLTAIAIWGIGLYKNAPQLLAGNSGIVGTSTSGTWLGIVLMMVLACSLATLSLRRALSARAALRMSSR
ncbi:hypothetical protein EPA93_12210 [Ktedonosporobacter rubrisoli]|uniref:Uncharacterized protein n=1 Tax=Ktedonosporobacter rubrisoli TaxID=2509675 RepID=A0A4P6JPN1_KTERU|nr:hypothetical protein [Ktedonosporobacter rubrisoli]QBD76726.1 hypothetical protein EPA93_12210 [Ktedonosporobacter rubrisoli]